MCFCHYKSGVFGHYIQKEGVSTDPNKLKAVEEWHVPNKGSLVWLDIINALYKTLVSLLDL